MEPMAPSCNASSPQPRPNPAELPGQPLGSKQHAGPPGCAEGSSRKPSSIMGLREHLQRDAARGQAASSALQNGSGTLPSVPPLAPRGSGQQCRSLRCSPPHKTLPRTPPRSAAGCSYVHPVFPFCSPPREPPVQNTNPPQSSAAPRIPHELIQHRSPRSPLSAAGLEPKL